MKSIVKVINIRNISIWLVIWGNIVVLIDILLNYFSIFNNSQIKSINIYFYSALISFIFCYWLTPKVRTKVNFISKSNNFNN